MATTDDTVTANQADRPVPTSLSEQDGGLSLTEAVVAAKTNGQGIDGKGMSTTHANGKGAKPVTLAICGAGQRGIIYAEYALLHPDLAKVTVVCDNNPYRRKTLAKAHGVPAENQYDGFDSLIKAGKQADAIVVATMDQTHAALVRSFSQQGYHILCEKPMSTSIADCVSMVRDVASHPGMIFGMGHVLRYSPYNQAIKQVIDSGILGEIVNIKHIEPVGDIHFANSFVRGNWRREDETSFALMTKCCHDIDILNYYLSHLPAKRVSSFGSLFHFKQSRKPKEAGDATRCTDCAYEPECSWSAKKIYCPSDDKINKWARNFMNEDDMNVANVTEALKTSSYGRCVYECDNDVVDHQVVNIEYESGATATMTMAAFTEAECNRRTEIQGTKGELIGDMFTFKTFDFLTRQWTHHKPLLDDFGMHGGGDLGLARAFVNGVAKGDQSELGVTPEDVLDSHLLVFAAERARRRGTVVDYKEFKGQCLDGSVGKL